MSSRARTVHIFGATGSVGQAALDVVKAHPGEFEVGVVTAHGNARKLAEIAIACQARHAVAADPACYEALQSYLAGTGITCAAGINALSDAATRPSDVTLMAIVGIAALRPVLAAMPHAKILALASKEPIVAAGALVMRAAAKHNTKIVPVDSEHNAIFQVFDFGRPDGIEKIILTASGGPFRTWTHAQMRGATLAQALAHPNWTMGAKISIDSATMMNKALEIIEAAHLFNMNAARVDVLVHPQSVVHSLVEYKDGSILAQMAASDMRTPIAHALAWPGRIETPGRRLDLQTLKTLEFEPPDPARFPALQLAYEAWLAGPGACAALNAANETAVEAFLSNAIAFTDIVNVVQHCLTLCQAQADLALEDIINLDALVRRQAQDYIQTLTSYNPQTVSA